MTSKVYTKTYSDMGGVDFSGEPSTISPQSFAYLENMYRDYGYGGGMGVETIPGYRSVTKLTGPVYAFHPHPTDRESLLVHAGSTLYRFDTRKRNQGGTPPVVMGGTGLSRQRSNASLFEGKLYLLDGKNFSFTNGETLTPLTAVAYRPTVYSDGEPFEERSLLTDLADEEYHLFSPKSYPYATKEGLEFSLYDNGACYFSGYSGSESVLVVPARVTLGPKEYAVVGVEAYTLLKNTTVKELVLSEGVTELKAGAFLNALALEKVVLPEGITRLPYLCFSDCPLLKTVYTPKSLVEIGVTAFDKTTVTELHYLGSKGDFFALPGYTELVPLKLPDGFQFFEYSAYPTVRCHFPLHLPTAELLAVTLDGEPLSQSGEVLFRPVLSEGSRGQEVTGIYLEAANENAIYGRTLRLSLRLFDTFSEELAAEGRSFSGNAISAVCGCTILARFDGRLFLSGNPALPGMVFYTGRTASGKSDPSYIGHYNRFTDGDGRAEIRALLPTADTLIVLAEDTPDAPSIFCHTPTDTGDDLIPRIYPLTEGIGGLGCTGQAILFGGEALFLSPRGLTAIAKTPLFEERGVSPRSSPVDVRLLGEDLAKATLFRFDTYLGIAVGGRVYLADGRRRNEGGYDWYYLSGIGAFSDDVARYRFVSGLLPAELEGVGVAVGDKHLILATAEEGYADGLPIYSFKVGDFTFSCAVRDGYAHPVNYDGERYGGVFSPASAFAECAGLLYFGTEEGNLFVFNTDMRGKDGIIPRRYYSFSGHAYTSGCATRLDDCGLPNYRKSTVRSGGAVRLKAMTGGKVEVRARTEDGVFTVEDTLYGGRGDFSEIDFASAEFTLGEDTVLPLREAKRRWVEKQLYFVSEEYQRPFGLLSVTYEYRVAGRIRT